LKEDFTHAAQTSDAPVSEFEVDVDVVLELDPSSIVVSVAATDPHPGCSSKFTGSAVNPPTATATDDPHPGYSSKFTGSAVNPPTATNDPHPGYCSQFAGSEVKQDTFTGPGCSMQTSKTLGEQGGKQFGNESEILDVQQKHPILTELLADGQNSAAAHEVYLYHIE